MSLDGAFGSIARNGAILRVLESHVERLEAAGDDASAAGWAQVAGHFCTFSHPGVFGSPRLERALERIGRRLGCPITRPVMPAPRKVLHVLTEGYDTGGHTRLAWRWIELDRERTHDVLLTAQRCPVPAPLAGAAAASGGTLRALDPGSSLFDRARELRTAAAGADLVVLHVHPFDVLPCIALAGRQAGPSVVFVDHADHLFWLGAGVADCVTACRGPAGRLAVERRAVEEHRSVGVPVPVHPQAPVTAAARAGARTALGLPADAPLFLTVAAEHKFMPVVEPSFFDAAAAALAACEDAILVAVGPQPSEPWQALGAATGGRVRAEGPRPDLEPYRAAADVYLDSHPFSSNTAVIEAAGSGLPVVSFAPDPVGQDLLLTHDPGIEGDIVRAAGVDEYAGKVAGLVADADTRAAVGERLRAGIEASHCGAGWDERREAAIAAAIAAGHARPPAGTCAPGEVRAFEAIHHLLFQATGQTCTLAGAVAAQLGALPVSERPRTGAELAALTRWIVAAAPGADAGAITAALDDFRALDAAGLAERLVLTVPSAQLDAAVPLVERALASGADIELDLVAAESPDELGADRMVLMGGAA